MLLRPVVRPVLRRVLDRPEDEIRNSLAELLGTSPYYHRLTHSLILNRAANESFLFSRSGAGDSTSTGYDHEGREFTSLGGEAVFLGARRVRNLIATTSEDFTNAAWLKISSGGPAAPSVNATPVSPPAGYKGKAYAVTFPAVGAIGTGAKYSVIGSPVFPGATTNKNVPSIFVRNPSGASTIYLYCFVSGVVTFCQKTMNLTTEWQRIEAPAEVANATSANCRMYIGCNNGFAAMSGGIAAQTIEIFGAQVEDVTGQSVQAAGEYVSVGALDYRSTQNNLYLSLPGTAGHYASTSGTSPTVNPSFRVMAALADWTPTGAAPLISHNNALNDGYIFNIDTGFTGKLSYTAYVAGAYRSILSSVAPSPSVFTDTALFGVGLDHDTTTGTVTFLTSADGITWTPLGTPQSITAGAVVASSSQIRIGQNNADTVFTNGRIYSAQVYKNGVLDRDFNPHRDATSPTGTFVSSTTGETYTLNGASSVIRSAVYHGSNVDGVKCFDTDYSGNLIAESTLEGLLMWPATANLQRVSRMDVIAVGGITSGWVNESVDALLSNLTTILNDAVSSDGTQSMTRFTANADNARHATYYQDVSGSGTVVTANTTYTVGFEIKAGSTTKVRVDWVTGGWASGCYVNATLSGDGSIDSAGIYGTGEYVASKIQKLKNGNYVVTLTGKIDNVTALGYLTLSVLRADGTLTYAGAGEYVWASKARIVAGTGTADIYVPTVSTTPSATVSRNADVFTGVGGNVPNFKALSATYRRNAGVSAAAEIMLTSDNTLVNYEGAYLASSTQQVFTGVAAGVNQWFVSSSNAYSPGSFSRVAWSKVTNSIIMAKDGVGQTPDASATLPAVTQINIGHLNGTIQLAGTIKDVMGWTRDLPSPNVITVSRV